MPHFLADEFKELVRSRTDIVSLIAEGLTLQPVRGGREFVGLCPFHDDHNPSMRVYPDRQSFKCWVCDIGGDVFSFVMQYESVTFPEALRTLAERAGIELSPAAMGPGHAERGKKLTLYDVMAWAESEIEGFMRT